jgi:hypothetical protein
MNQLIKVDGKTQISKEFKVIYNKKLELAS